MKKVTGALAVLLALTLTGCAGPTETAGGESTAPVVSESATPEEPAAPTPEVTAAPITAAPEPSDLPAAPATPEDEFVAASQNYLNGWGYWDFTNEQLLGAGIYACESADAEPQVIEGLDPMYSPTVNAEIVGFARTILCP